MPLFFVLTWLKHFLLCNQPITDFTVIPGRTLVTCYTDFRESIFFSCKSKNIVYQQKIFIHIFTTVSNRPLHRDINSPFSVLLQEVKISCPVYFQPYFTQEKDEAIYSICVCVHRFRQRIQVLSTVLGSAMVLLQGPGSELQNPRKQLSSLWMGGNSPVTHTECTTSVV